MRITTRVSVALFLMAILLIVSLTYQLSQVERLQRVNREVSLINMEGARISLRLLQSLNGVHEFAAKYQVVPGDPDYLNSWREWERAVDTDLQLLGEVGLSEEELEAYGGIQEGWREYREVASLFETEPTSVLPGVVFPQMQRILDSLRGQVENLIAINESVVAAQAAASGEATDRARQVAWVSAGSALGLAALLSLLLYRSISGPLRRLTRGTREIARGRFDHRLRIQGPRELSSLAKDFDRMAARLDELENLKRDFVSHVSHELKTPLAAIQETIELLLDGIPGPLTSKQARLLELSKSSSTRLSSMISDLLETSRLEAGASGYTPGWHDVAEVIRSVLDEMEPLAVERGLEVYLRVETLTPELACDRNRMREVIVNLVSNAVKFSPEDRRVRLILSEQETIPEDCPDNREAVRAEEGPFLLLSVEDEGPGVPDRDKEGIFEKFHQVRRGERLRGQGVGLGLAISWRVVEAHAGAIWVEDREVGGSVFRVLLPKVPSHWSSVIARQPLPEVPEPDPGERMTISVGGGMGRVALSLLTAVVVSGCASVESTPNLPPPPIPDPTDEPIVAAPVETPPELDVPPADARLSTGWSLLSNGEYESAYRQFLSVMREESPPRPHGEAVWGMAYLHLTPDSPYFEPDWAQNLLAYLQRAYPMDQLGVQAAWVEGLLAEFTRVRLMAEEQDAALQQLEETVEQLKNIDLNRAPTAPRPSAIAPSPSPGGPGG